MLKSLLSLLLSKFYSKQESEAVGHQAMPSTQTVALTQTTTSIDDWGAVYNGVAPTDGFACIRFTADTTTCIASAQTQNVSVFTTPQVVGDILLCACPIAKGQVFTLCARQAKNIECWFTKTIGGGYQILSQLILQGGAICLSNLCSSLRRNSWLVRRRVFRTGRTPTSQIILPFSFHLQKTVLFIHPQATDGCRCTLGTRGLLTSQLILTQRIIAQSCLAFCLPLSVGTATFIEYVKALMSRSQLQLLYRKDGLCFFRLINSAVGGASC